MNLHIRGCVQFLILLIFCLPLRLWAQIPFEGTLHYKLSWQGAYLRRVDSTFAGSMRLKIKDKWMLADYYGKRHPADLIGRVLVDCDSQIVYKLFDSLQIAQKQLIELDASPYKEYAKARMTVHPKLERVAGYDCRKVSGTIEMPMSGGACNFELWIWEDFEAPGNAIFGEGQFLSSLGSVPQHKGLILKKRLNFSELKLSVTQTCTKIDFNLHSRETFTFPKQYTVGKYFPLEELPTRGDKMPNKRLYFKHKRLALPGKPNISASKP